MATSTTVSFTAAAGGFNLGGSRFFGPPAEVATVDFQGREPVAWAAGPSRVPSAALSLCAFIAS